MWYCVSSSLICLVLFDHIRLCPWPWEHEGLRPVLRLEPGLFACTNVHNTYTHTHMLTCKHIHIIYSDTCTLHTCGSCRWYFLNSLMCAFPPLSSGERPVAAEGSSHLCDRGLWGIFLLGRRRVSQGWQKHFSFGWRKGTSVVMHLCGGCKAADYQSNL